MNRTAQQISALQKAIDRYSIAYAKERASNPLFPDHGQRVAESRQADEAVKEALARLLSEAGRGDIAQQTMEVW